MKDKVVILDEMGKYEASGLVHCNHERTDATIYLEEDENISEFQFPKDKMLKLIVRGSYYELYVAKVEQYDNNTRKLYIYNMTNDEQSLKEDLKVEVNYNINIMYYENDNMISAEAETRDLSAGGFCFVMKANLEVDKEYEAVFSFLEEAIIIRFKIVRKIYHDTDNKYIYGCKFVNLSRKEEEIIRKKVFMIVSQRRQQR